MRVHLGSGKQYGHIELAELIVRSVCNWSLHVPACFHLTNQDIHGLSSPSHGPFWRTVSYRACFWATALDEVVGGLVVVFEILGMSFLARFQSLDLILGYDCGLEVFPMVLFLLDNVWYGGTVGGKVR